MHRCLYLHYVRSYLQSQSLLIVAVVVLIMAISKGCTLTVRIFAFLFTNHKEHIFIGEIFLKKFILHVIHMYTSYKYTPDERVAAAVDHFDNLGNCFVMEGLLKIGKSKTEI